MKKLLYYTILATLTFAPGLALAAQPTIDQLLAQIAALQAQVRQLQQSQQPPQPTLPPLPTTTVVAEQGQNIPSFNRDLSFGKKGEDVRDLQEFLTDQRYYAGPITGNYGLLTVQAVKKFQQANGITPASGYFGAKTRALANKIFRELVGRICGEEGCEDNILPPQQLTISVKSLTGGLNATVGEYFAASFIVSGGSGNYEIDTESKLPASLSFTRTYCPPFEGFEGGIACTQVLSQDSVTLFGTPQKSGVFDIVIFAKGDGANGMYGRETFTTVIKDKVSTGRQPVIRGVKGPTTLKVGEEGVWSVEAQDPSNGALVYRVVWGDEYKGEATTPSPQSQRAIPFRQTATFAHTYYNAGVYSPTFYVVNDRGSEVRTSISVNVSEAQIPPVLRSQSINFRAVNDNAYNSNYADIALSIQDVNGKPAIPVRETGYAPHFNLSPGSYNAVLDAREYSNNGRMREQVKVSAQFYTNGNEYRVNGDTVRVYENGRLNESDSAGWLIMALLRPGGVYVTGAQRDESFEADFTLTDSAGDVVNTASSIVPGYRLPVGRYTARISLRENSRNVSESAAFSVEANATGYIIKEVSQTQPPVPVQPSITVLSPSSGEFWKEGESRTISWSGVKGAATYKLTLLSSRTSFPARHHIDTIPSKLGSSETYLWGIPLGVGSADGKNPVAYYVRIAAFDRNGNEIASGQSNEFTIGIRSAGSPSITVTSPNGGEVWKVGETRQIRWNETINSGESVRIYIVDRRIESSGSTNYITPNGDAVRNTGVYNWTVPALSQLPGGGGQNYRIRVEDVQYGISDESDAPFSIVAGGTTGYTLSASYVSGNKSSYAAGEKISLTIKGIELFDGSPGEPSEGFNVQVYIRGINDSYSLQGVNAVYNSQTGYWEAKLTAPADTAKTYKVESSFYCSNESSVCSRRYVSGKGEAGGQVNSSFDFSVYGSGKTPVMVVSPNGGESYQAGQSAQMPIKWTADCGYKSFSILLAKGTYSGSSSQTINDSIPAGICSSGQSAIPYYTTWPIPSNLAAGSDYKILVTGQLADSVVGQFGTGVGDDSNASFTITAATISTPSITVTSPNGGEVIKTGQRNTIRWNLAGAPLIGAVNIKLNYSPVGYLYDQVQDIIAQNAPNTGTFEWVPSEFYLTGIVPGSFRITIEAADSSDSSNSGFSVAYGSTAPRLVISSPRGGETFVAGQIVPVTWTPHTSGNSFSLTLLKKNDSSFARWDSMYFDNALNGLVWRVPNGLSAGDYYLKVEEVVSGPGRGIIGYSNSFTIAAGSQQPSITVTSPNGGEILELGKSYTFRWNTTGNIGPVDILIVDVNEGRSSALQALTVATSVVNTGSYTVVLPTDTTYFSNNTRFGAPNYKVHLSGLCNPCADTEIQRVVDESDNVFILKKPSSAQPSIAVTSPNGGERFVQGVNNTLSWQGGKNIVRLGLVKENATNQADPAPLIIGWMNEIDTARYTQSSIAWDGKQVCDLNFVACKPVAPGNYKLIASSQDANGNFVLWDNVANKPGNWDISNAPFSILAAQTVLSCSDVSVSQKSYFDLCRSQGYENACFNKYSGAYQGCTRNSSNDCTVNNTNATQNLLCSVGAATQPSITVTSPNGGETFVIGSPMTVRWSTQNFPNAPVNVYLFTSAVTPSTEASYQFVANIAFQTANDGSEAWTIPASIAPGSRYFIRILGYDATGYVFPDGCGNGCRTDDSDAPFTIAATSTIPSSGGGGSGGGDGAMNTGGNQNLASLLSAMQASLDKIKEAAEKLR